jgi:uncharacterized protein
LAYLCGRDVDRDTSEGLHWLREAIAAGNAQAGLALGKLYEQGVILPANEAEAIRLYEAVAKDPLWGAFAMQRLAQIYQFGTGVAADFDRALNWLRRAEEDFDRKNEQGGRVMDPAGEDIGFLYAQGKGVPRDYGVAAQWFLKVTGRPARVARSSLPPYKNVANPCGNKGPSKR